MMTGRFHRTGTWLFFALIFSGLINVSLQAQTAAPNTAPLPGAGVAVHYYGETSFWIHGSSFVSPSLALDINVNRLKSPPMNWDEKKGPIFHRGGGWSLACRGAIAAPAAGEYRFKVEGALVELCVNGAVVASDGSEIVRLKQGNWPIALYWKSTASGQSTDTAKFRVTWCKPGQSEYEGIPAGAFSHQASDESDEAAWRPEIPFDNVQPGLYAQRQLPFEIKESGQYEIAAHLGSIGRIFQVWLDGEPLIYVQGQRAGVKESEQRLDYMGRASVVRQLKAGKHVATVYGHHGPWVWSDEMDLVLKYVRIGATKIKESDLSSSSLSINLLDKAGQNRSDLVLRKGEPLIVQLEKNTDAPERLTLEVKAQRGDGKVLWTGEAKLPARKTPASGQVRYPCDKEGAFEYTIKDNAGKVVDGPWAFVVVDATPIEPAKTGAAPAELKGEIIDTIDCSQAGDAQHKFRDNGTSQVIDSAVGRYRVTGTNLLRPIGYVKEGKGWRRAKAGEKSEGPEQYAADWFAYTMAVKHPGKAHVLVAYVPNDVHRLVSVQAFDQLTGSYNGWCLEAGDAPEGGPYGKLSFLIWPNSNAIDVLTWCSNDNHGSKLNRQGAVAKFELLELPDGLPAAPSAKNGWNTQREVGWEGEQVNLGIVERTTPTIWEGNELIPGSLGHGVYSGAAYCDWNTLFTAWDRFGQLSAFRGDNLCVAPVYTYGMTCIQGAPHLPKSLDVYSTGYKGRVVDPIERDIFKMMLLVAEKYNIKMVADFMVHRLEEGTVESFAQSAGLTNMDGVLVTNPQGKVLRTISNNAMLNPAHPMARRYFLTIIDEIASRYGSFPAFAGVKIRQWGGWPSATDVWYINEQNGYDDFTVTLFEKETGFKAGVTDTSDGRFALRQKALLSEGKLREAWLDWRCKKVQTLLEEAVVVVRKHAPNAKLYSGITLGGDAGSFPPNRAGGVDIQKLDGKRDIGFEAHRRFNGEGVEWNFPDPIDFANFDVREPASLRRTMENFHPNNGFNYPIGMCCAESFRSHPYQLEAPAKALADNQLDMFTYGPAWCLPPIDEGFRKFVQVFRAIPTLSYTRFTGKGVDQPVFNCWSATRKVDGSILGSQETVFYVVNRTAKHRDVEVTFASSVKNVTNMVDGQRIVADKNVAAISLDPFMPAVFVVDGSVPIAEIHVAASTAELDEIKQRIESVKAIRDRTGKLQHTFAQVSEASSDGGWNRYVNETFDDAWLAIPKALQGGQPFQASELLDRMIDQRTWWFEAFGWPAGNTSKRVAEGVMATPEALSKNLKADGTSSLTTIAPFKSKFMIVPTGKATWNAGLSGGVYELRAWGLFGGGYGPIQVLVDGREVGHLGVVSQTTSETQYIMSGTLALQAGGHMITFIAQGNKGLALSALQMSTLAPTPIKRWSLLGVFDKGTPADVPREGGADGMNKVFGPEQKLDLKAVYSGMDGKEIHWQQIDLGSEPFVRLLEKYFPGATGNSVAYLACWVQSPTERDTDLYYAMDWFGKVWVNDQVVLPEVSGPWKRFATQKVHLKIGWNKLLIKTARGSEGWMANAALGDPGDLKYSPLPPQP